MKVSKIVKCMKPACLLGIVLLFSSTSVLAWVVENCEPRTQGYWHRQCLGTEGINPGRNGRGPQLPTEENFDPELINCADAMLDDLFEFPDTTCEGMDADPANDKCEKALKQLTAMILNICSGRLDPGTHINVDPEGCTSMHVGDLKVELASLIEGGECAKASDCAAAVNEGVACELPH